MYTSCLWNFLDILIYFILIIKLEFGNSNIRANKNVKLLFLFSYIYLTNDNLIYNYTNFVQRLIFFNDKISIERWIQCKRRLNHFQKML